MLGRPNLEDKRDNTLKVRFNDEEYRKLETVAKETNSTKSEVIRKGIELQYERSEKQ